MDTREPRAEIIRRLPKNETIAYYMCVWLAPYPGLLTAKGIDQWNAVFEPVPVKRKKTESVHPEKNEPCLFSHFLAPCSSSFR